MAETKDFWGSLWDSISSNVVSGLGNAVGNTLGQIPNAIFGPTSNSQSNVTASNPTAAAPVTNGQPASGVIHTGIDGIDQLLNTLITGAVAGISNSPAGAAVQEQAADSAIAKIVKNPVTWIVSIGVIVLAFILLRKR